MINIAGKKPRILVVDDELKNRLLVEAMLIPLGYEVIMAVDGKEALKKTIENSPDVILLDVMMPGMDGFEVANRIKTDEATRIIPVVMVTALSEVSDRVKALDAGADDFLVKPVDRTELRARVKSLVNVKACNDYMRSYQKELEAEVARRTYQLQQALEKLKKASLDTIYRLSRAAEYKDKNTGGHIRRMSRYAAAVARSLGLDAGTVEMILYAAPMHDVGKIGIPDHILMKPAKLDPEEWEIMKQHNIMGMKILETSDAEFIKLAEVIALNHHEKWDGTGYPRGLKGTDIPLPGRIVAIADVFDVLTTERPYKPAYSVEESFEILGKGRGTHFDPEVVDAFFRVKDEILSIKETA